MPNKTPSQILQQFLSMLDGLTTSEKGWTALCPAHGDRKNSLSIAEGLDGRVLLKCFAGCDPAQVVAAVGLEMADLFPKSRSRQKSGIRRTGGLTLAEYAEAKQLRVDFLKKIGLGEIYLQGAPALRIPYFGLDGTTPAIRMRVSLKGDTRFLWKTGSKLLPYGLWRKRNSESTQICLVEGESDCHTLWFNGFPALGLPGAATWREEWVPYFERFEKIYVVVEPDKGGDSLQSGFRNSNLRGRIHLITLKSAKDPSELYLNDPDNFRTAWKEAKKNAIPWREVEEADRKNRRRQAWTKCKDIAIEEDILTLFVDDLRRRNVVGETRSAKLLYLAVTSRFLERPVSTAIVATSGAGKSFVVESTLEHFPGEAFYALTAMSERALIYSLEPLRNRFLVLYEGAALDGEFQNYVVRSLLSEGRLKYETVEKTADGIQSRLIEREGPTGLILTTTAVSLHPENDTRYLTIPVSDSSAQTQRVLLALAKATNSEGKNNEVSVSLETWRELQKWLELANHRVLIPYATALAELIPPVAVRLRRDFTAILHLIKAHAILHQATRDRDETGRIIATIGDYRAIWDLVKDLVSEGVEETVSKTIRATVAAVAEICKEKVGQNGGRGGSTSGEKDLTIAASVLDVAKTLELDRSSASRRLKQGLTRGYLMNIETRRGQPMRMVLCDPLPGTGTIMPSPGELKNDKNRN